MSFKTDRLANLFPDAYAAGEGGSLLHGLLDALGHELLAADAAVKALLKSHWIAYASGGGLDGLGALLGVQRRLLADGTPEGDDTFRPLVRSTVPSFVGGGTVAAIQGAVRAALGLPYDLALFRQQLVGTSGAATPGMATLLAGLEALVQVQEFSPKAEVMLGSAAAAAGGSTLSLVLDFTTIDPLPPRVAWHFAEGARSLSLLRQDTGTGVRSRPGFAVAPGDTLVLTMTGSAPGVFSASVGSSDVSAQFTAADGSSPPALPQVPSGQSTWLFAAGRGAAFDASAFDRGEPYDSSAFSVSLQWLRLQPLVFDVVVPYFVDAAVRRLMADSGYGGRFTLFKGLTLDAIQRVVDRSRAAGVRGTVQYAVRLPSESAEARPWDDAGAQEQFSAALAHRTAEQLDADEALAIGTLDREAEQHDASERFVIGGNYNVAVFDGAFGFL